MRAVAWIDEAERTGEHPRIAVPDEGERCRPKALRLGEHAPTVAIVSDAARADSTPELAPSEIRSEYDERVRVLLIGVMRRARVSCGDVGAAIALSEKLVAKSRALGGRALGVRDLWMMAVRGEPRLRAVLRPLLVALRDLDGLETEP